jgi:hypothetical protein
VLGTDIVTVIVLKVPEVTLTVELVAIPVQAEVAGWSTEVEKSKEINGSFPVVPVTLA